MKNIYTRSNYSIKNININIIIALSALILYGFYKNGIKIYINDAGNIYDLLKPLLLTTSGFLSGSLANLIYEKYIKKSKKESIIFSSLHPAAGVVVASILSINTNILIFFVTSLIIFLISKKYTNFNFIALTFLVSYILTPNFTYLNSFEKTKEFSLNFIDYFSGLGSGGVNTTNLFMLLVIFVILMTRSYYKSSIPVSSMITYTVFTTIYLIITKNTDQILISLFTNSILFSFIFVATYPQTSSYTKYGKIIYGILTGFLTFVISLINPIIAPYTSILIISLFHKQIDKITLKKA